MKNRQLLLALSLAVLVVGTGASYWLLSRSTSSALFAELGADQASAAMAYLSEREVPFEIVNDLIMVESSRSSDLRMELINEGVIQPERSGFEMFAEVDYGQTEFSQRINYQRALQAELERSIISIDGVKQARVHLKIGQKKLLFSAQQPATASVMIQLKDGYSVSRKQVKGIQVLIAGAVDNIQPGDVSVIDQNGQVLSRPDGDAGVGDPENGSTTLQRALKASAEALLAEVLEKDNFKVEVAVDYDNSKRKRRVESLANVQDKAVLKRADNGPIDADNKETASGQRRSEIEYVYGKQIEEIEFPSSVVSRISVGVVTSQSIAPSRLVELNKLLFAGLGLQPARGDVVEIYISEPKAGRPLITEIASSVAVADDGTLNLSSNGAVASVEDANGGALAFFSPSVAVIMFLVAFTAFSFLGLRRSQARKLAKERALLLEEVRQWLKSA